MNDKTNKTTKELTNLGHIFDPEKIAKIVLTDEIKGINEAFTDYLKTIGKEPQDWDYDDLREFIIRYNEKHPELQSEAWEKLLTHVTNEAREEIESYEEPAIILEWWARSGESDGWYVIDQQKESAVYTCSVIDGDPFDWVKEEWDDGEYREWEFHVSITSDESYDCVEDVYTDDYTQYSDDDDDDYDDDDEDEQKNLTARIDRLDYSDTDGTDCETVGRITGKLTRGQLIDLATNYIDAEFAKMKKPKEGLDVGFSVVIDGINGEDVNEPVVTYWYNER